MKNHLNTQQHRFWLWLTSEISERMSQNLPFIKIQPKNTLLFGNFEFKTFKLLSKTYPQTVLWTDQQIGLMQKFLQKLNPFKKLSIQTYLSESLSNNPSFAEHFEMIWAGPLQLSAEEYPRFFSDSGNCLKSQGLLMFSYLGPDTGKEFRNLFSQTGKVGPDMHDIGDHLTKSGFADPVMHMEYIHLEYESSQLLIKDILEIGLMNQQDAKSSQLETTLNASLESQSKLSLTLEIVYGHAWKVPKKELGVTRISPESILKTYKK
jgi:malonyl-CoA O-methyltransferase